MRAVRSLGIIVVVGAWLAVPSLSQATTYYVDNACPFDGNGVVDQCASSDGAPGARNSAAGLQATLSAVVAGDTVLIKTGNRAYVTNNAGGRGHGGFHIDRSGTEGNPITVKAHPRHAPILSACDYLQIAWCTHPTVTAEAQSYITLEGLTVLGSIRIMGDDAPTPPRGIIIKNNNISGGWESPGDGNWSGVWLSHVTAPLVQNNQIRDIRVLAGGGAQTSASCIKLYSVTGAVVEHNTCRNVEPRESQAGGIDDKEAAVTNIHRYNWIENVNTCVRVNNQLRSFGVQVYGNVCISQTSVSGTGSPGIKLLTQISGIEIYNNTVYGFDVCMAAATDTLANVRIYNNICARVGSFNYENYTTAEPSFSDYNAFDRRQFRIGLVGMARVYSSLAAWVAGERLDANSREGDCRFVSPGTDFHLSSDSICRMAGRAAGKPDGAVMDVGAYGVTPCVGRACSVPAPPTNVRIIR